MILRFRIEARAPLVVDEREQLGCDPADGIRDVESDGFGSEEVGARERIEADRAIAVAVPQIGSEIDRQLVGQREVRGRRELDIAIRVAVELPVVRVAGRVGAVEVERPAERVPLGQRRCRVAVLDRMLVGANQGDAIALAPFLHRLPVEMNLVVVSRTAPCDVALMRQRGEHLDARVADQAGVDAHELAVVFVGTVAVIGQAAVMVGRIPVVEGKQPARAIVGGRVDIGRTLLQRQVLEILAVGELGRIGGVHAHVGDRHALPDERHLGLVEAAQRERTARQAPRILFLDHGAGEKLHQHERARRRRLLLDVVLRDGADRFRSNLDLHQAAARLQPGDAVGRVDGVARLDRHVLDALRGRSPGGTGMRGACRRRRGRRIRLGTGLVGGGEQHRRAGDAAEQRGRETIGHERSRCDGDWPSIVHVSNESARAGLATPPVAGVPEDAT